MRKLKRLIVMVVLLVAGLWIATQWAAKQMDYPLALDGCWFRTRTGALYAPWALLTWDAADPLLDSHVVRTTTAAYFLYMTAAIGLTAVLMRGGGLRVKTFGTEGWGTRRDMKRAGLMGFDGTVVGLHDGYLLTYDGPEHQLVSGASRSGKGVGHVIPTLLCWPDSGLVYDVKGELWQATAGFRRRCRHHCILFNPTRPDSARFNPLLEVRKGADEIRDVQNLVEMLVNPDGSKRSLSVWDQNASQFLVGLILHVLHAEPIQRKHLGRVRELLLDFDNTCKAMLTTPHRLSASTGMPEAHPEVARVARSLLTQADRFRSSVRGTAEGYLTLWADDGVCAVTSRSDFAVGDLVCLGKPLTLYLQPPPSDADRVRPLIRLMLNQSMRSLMENANHDARGRKKNHRLLFLLDEFPTLGKLEFFSASLRQMAGYGIKALLIVQSFNDIAEYYGPINSILDNCHLVVCFASMDTRTCQRVSEMAGEAVEYRDSYSAPQSKLDGGHRQVSRAEQVRSILTPAQVRTLPADQQLIFINGVKPLRTDKLRYYEHPDLRKRVMDPPKACLPAELAANPPRNDWQEERARWTPLPLPADVAERLAMEQGQAAALLSLMKNAVQHQPGDLATQVGEDAGGNV